MIALKIFLYGTLLLVAYLLVNQKKRKAILHFPVFLIILEVFFTFFVHFQAIEHLHGINLLFLLLFVSPMLLNKKLYTWSPPIIIFILYIALRINYHVDIVSLTTRLVNFSLLLLFIPLSYYSVDKISDIQRLNKSLHYLILIYCVFTVLASLTKFGVNMYNTGIIYGVAHNQPDAVALALGLMLIFSKRLSLKKSSKIIYLFALALLVLSLRRTPLLIVLTASFFYFYYQTGVLNKIRVIALTVPVAFLLIFALNYFGVELRLFAIERYKPHLSVQEKIEEEGRVKDITLIIETLDRRETAIWGSGYLFDTRGRYGLTGVLANRPIHNNYAEIIHGSGLVGLFLFLGIFAHIAYKSSIKNTKTKSNEMKSFKATLYFLLVSSVIIAVSGGVRAISASILYISIGVLLKFLSLSKLQHNYS
jgi:hypothetical protein